MWMTDRRMVEVLESSRRIRWTDRRSDQATMARQTIATRAKKPRAEPTAIKTVPSGRLECCMKGAFAVGGTLGAGYWETSDEGRGGGALASEEIGAWEADVVADVVAGGVPVFVSDDTDAVKMTVEVCCGLVFGVEGAAVVVGSVVVPSIREVSVGGPLSVDAARAVVIRTDNMKL